MTGSEQKAIEGWRVHCAASLSEGMCPVHKTPLKPVKARPPVVIGTHCRECCAFWSIDGEQTVTHAKDHRPVYDMGRWDGGITPVIPAGVVRGFHR